MRFKNINQLILFGGSLLLPEFIKIIPKNKYRLVVFSSPRHLAEKIIGRQITLRKFLEHEGIQFYSSFDINYDQHLKSHVDKSTLGLAFGAAWTFEPATVKLFNPNHLLDFMGIDLPFYYGGAHYSWKILNQNYSLASHLQIIKGGQASFQCGPLIKSHLYHLPGQLKTPLDYFKYAVKQEISFLVEFLSQLSAGFDFKITHLSQANSSYYPFLSTSRHAFINWHWSAKDIYLFINAFDDPYAGAMTFLRRRKVRLKKVKLLAAGEKYHPFASGLVIKKDESAIYLATFGHLLQVSQVLNSVGQNILQSIQLGDRFHTPFNQLDKSLEFKADYSPAGLKS